METSGIEIGILRQNPHLTRKADERHFFQLLRAHFEREAARLPTKNHPDRE